MDIQAIHGKTSVWSGMFLLASSKPEHGHEVSIIFKVLGDHAQYWYKPTHLHRKHYVINMYLIMEVTNGNTLICTEKFLIASSETEFGHMVSIIMLVLFKVLSSSDNC